MTLVDGLRAAYRSMLPAVLRKWIRSAVRNSRFDRVLSPVVSKLEHRLRPEQALAVEAKESLAKWRLPEALEKVDAALKVSPRLQKALQLRATILAKMGDTDRAILAAKQLNEFYPLDVSGLRQLRALGVEPPEPSRELALNAVFAQRGTASAFVTAMQYLYEAELFEDMLDFCSFGLSAASRETHRKDTLIGSLVLYKGRALESLYRYREAISVYESVLPNKSVNLGAATGIARCYAELGEPEKAETILAVAHSRPFDQMPFTPFGLEVLQAQGKILESYRLYRKKPISVALAKYFDQPHPTVLDVKAPENHSKKALVLLEGGPGDELRFASIYDDLAACFGDLTLTCDPRLHSIMTRNFPNISFLPVSRHRREFVREMPDRSTLTDALLFQCVSDDAIVVGRQSDVVCSLLDTFADLRPNRTAFRTQHPLKPLVRLRQKWTARLNPSRLNIGIAWRSMLQTVARNRHYLTAEELAPLAKIENADFWILQPRMTIEELACLRSFLPTVHVAEDLDLIDDFEEQIALVSCLDFVISPFTTTGELAGAVGTPTFLVSTTQTTSWRRNADGTDLWHDTTMVVTGNPAHDRQSALDAVVESINGRSIDRAQRKAAT